ncbi:mitochondrial pyruvate carrier 2-like [Gigantopelta aegis]|uniref:mitochondrial pyruvate carrier 2-like n=1 Tax=Gigantopelta aegis TaxID=1735272 RepID=UPI001B88D435|nr:mitochondrial pyruvate carrier 2-like [Gigantopelta aegis]
MSAALYRALITFGDRHVPPKFVPLWNHPAGPKTVHFWAPLIKWVLVIAGMGDIARPAENLSMYQSTALAATGTIWARYSLVIIPKNYSLFFVNVFVGSTGFLQLSRIIAYRRSLKEKQKALPSPETPAKAS